MARANALTLLIGGKPPRFRTATEYVESTLKEAILSGALPGGTPLRQEDLAAEFGLSRMPIREALRQLEAQALVDFYPHRGAVVTEISAAEGADNYAIRGALEPAALHLSVPNLTAADLARARELVEEMDSESGARLGELNRRFHMTLYSRAGRPRLLTLVDQQLAAADRFLRFHLAAMGRNHLSQEEHRGLIDACSANDADEACAILNQHIATAAKDLEAFFAPRGED
ncbi:MAG TPA: GntR family transcriptional regulator [Candidatus Binatia bacterium]|nr:GntR family transcriptional regulator [Candidatus Binatia bacterium]